MIKLWYRFTVYSLAAFISIEALHAQDISLDLGEGVKMEFVWIPLPGGERSATVQIGDFSGTKAQEPVHLESISGPFQQPGKEFGYYLGKTEVTEEQWAAVINSERKSKFPATKKTQLEILKFIEDLNTKTGQLPSFPCTGDGTSGVIRLPTEAEWEYAARGGASAVNYQASDPYQGDIERHEVFATTVSGGVASKVSTRQTNSLGLYDMLGNVRELVGGNYEVGGMVGGLLLKGGSYLSERQEIRSSARTEQSRTDKKGKASRRPDAGFRLCISADAFTSLGQAQKVKERLKADQEKEAQAKSRKDEATRLEQKLKQAEADAVKAREESERLAQEAAMVEKRKALELAEKKASEEKAKLEALKKQVAVGNTNESRTGAGIDESEEVESYHKAANQGDASAQCNLGSMYLNGTGVGKDEAEAVKWVRRSSDQGCAGGQFNLGDAYEKGTGVGKDEAEAVKWYRKAADQGNEEALKALKRLEQTAMAEKRKSLELAEKKTNEENPQSKQPSIPLAFDSAGFLPKGGGLLIYKTQSFYANNLAEAMLFTKTIPRGPTTTQYIGLGGVMAIVPSDGELGGPIRFFVCGSLCCCWVFMPQLAEA